jgi:GNAT superfamily N-acetyltransferase
MSKDIRQMIDKVKNFKESLNENKNNHLVEVTPNKYVYHTSNPGFRDKISKEGLRVKSKSVTWLSDTKIDGKVIFAVNSDNKKDWWDSTYDDDIYRIDTTNLNNKWYNDPNFDLDDKRIITFEDIPLNSIKLIYKGTGLDTLYESITIETPNSDSYNDIFVDGEKVGYIILSPARKEYYWVDVNLPNPLAIVDIKILKQFRGKNYMKETMNWLYNFAKENGYKSLFLRVDDDSEINQETLFQIYQKYGFSVYKTTDDEDDVFMYKLL